MLTYNFLNVDGEFELGDVLGLEGWLWWVRVWTVFI